MNLGPPRGFLLVNNQKTDQLLFDLITSKMVHHVFSVNHYTSFPVFCCPSFLKLVAGIKLKISSVTI